MAYCVLRDIFIFLLWMHTNVQSLIFCMVYFHEFDRFFFWCNSRKNYRKWCLNSHWIRKRGYNLQQKYSFEEIQKRFISALKIHQSIGSKKRQKKKLKIMHWWRSLLSFELSILNSKIPQVRKIKMIKWLLKKIFRQKCFKNIPISTLFGFPTNDTHGKKHSKPHGERERERNEFRSNVTWNFFHNRFLFL